MRAKPILIVDDDASFRDNLEDILKDEGYESFSASLCAEALNLAKSRKIEAALLDLKLPDGSGTNLISELKHINPDCVCIIMTGYADLDSAIASMEHGAFHYLQKPVKLLELLKLLEKIFETIKLIEEKRQAEKALKESEQTMRSLLNAFPTIAYLINTDGIVLAGNQVAAESLGKEIHQIAGVPLSSLFADWLVRDRMAKVKEVIHSGKSLRFEEIVEGRYFDTVINPVLSSCNEIKKLAIFIQDITKNKRAEEEKRMLEDQLFQSQKMEAIGTLAGGIAHDFNNILTIIIGYTDLIKNTSIQDDNILMYRLDQILQASYRARDMVKQILLFSRQRKQDKVSLHITSIIKEVLQFLRSSLPSTIEIREKIDVDLMIIKANPTQIHQVLMNLSTNAADAMSDSGGVLEVGITSVLKVSETAANFHDLPDGKYIQLTVKDNGHGMEPEMLKKIFDPYFTTKEVGKGTGLGLSVVHGIVKSHGGAIKVKSKVGQGTTFYVYFPQIESNADIKARPYQSLPIGNEHILLVDDEETVVHLTTNMLEQLNYRVTGLTNSINALETFRLKPNEFNLVITDMTMPYMTGDILAQELLKIRPEIPIILCTGYSEKITQKKSDEIGINALLMKPLNMLELANIIRNVLDNKI